MQIDNLTPGDHSGQIRIKEGLVQTVSTFLKSELTFTDVNVTTTGPPVGCAVASPSSSHR